MKILGAKGMKKLFLCTFVLILCLTTLVACNTATVSKIEMLQNPTVVEYEIGDTISIEGAKITITFSNGKQETKSIDSTMVDLTQVNTSTIGEKKLDVNYLGKTTSITFFVKISSEVAAVIAKINNLPAIKDITLKDEISVISTRTAYEALTNDEKVLVTNLSILEAIEIKVAELKLSQAEVVKVVTKIVQLPLVDHSKLEDEVLVIAARTAYEALTDEQKALVVNYAVLQKAEKRITELKLEN